MKTSIKNLFVVLCGLSLFACSDPDEGGTKPSGNGKWTLGSTTNTRAAIGGVEDGKRAINWATGDALSVFNGSVNAAFTLTGGEGTSSATFESTSEDLANGVTYYAVHTNGLHQYSSETGVMVNFPAAKTVSGEIDQFVNDNIVMLSGGFQFSDMSVSGVTLANQIAVLEVPVKIAAGSPSLSSVTMETNVADYFVTSAVYDGAGAAAYTYATSLTVNFETAVALSETAVMVKVPVWMNPSIDADAVEGKSFTLTFTGSSTETIAVLTKPAVLLTPGKYYSNTNTQSIDDVTVNGVQLVSGSAYTGYSSASVALTQNQVVAFNNFTNLRNQINPEFFEYISPTTAKFLGLDGTYEMHLQDANGYIFIEEKDAADGVWLMSNNLGFPNHGYDTKYKTATSWGWITPDKYTSFRKVSENVYSGTIYMAGWISGYFLSSKSSTMPGGGVGASHRLDTENYTFTSSPDNLFKPQDVTGDDQKGRIIVSSGGTIASRIYRFTINTAEKTLHAEQVIETVKDIPLVSGASYAGYQSASVSLVQNEVVEFKNFKNLRNQLYPEFFEYVSDTEAKFLGQSGTYELHLNETDGHLFVDLKGDAAGIWMIWNSTGFPNYGYDTQYKSSSSWAWNWNEPKRALFFRKVSDDVFSGMIYCSGSLSGYFVTVRNATIPPNQNGRQDYRLPLFYDNWNITTNVPNEDSTNPITIGQTGGDTDRFIHANGVLLGSYRWRVTVTMSTKNVHFERLTD